MSAPARFTSGITQSPNWSLMGRVGVPNPFFYSQYAEDFIVAPSPSSIVTTTVGGASNNINGDRGIRSLVTSTTSGGFVSDQLTTAPFAIRDVGKKLVFGARISLSTITAKFTVGLANINTTPFNTGITDGIFFTGDSGVNFPISLVVVSGGATSVPNGGIVFNTSFIPTINSFFDLICEVSGKGVISWAVTPNALGFIPQSGTGTPGSTIRTPTYLYDIPISLQPSSAISPIWAVQTTAASSATMSVDYVYAFKER